MEVDSSIDNAGARTRETRIAVHPLAIVHMSDQYTRVSSGGSPLDKTAPVVGLLFGLSNDLSCEAAASTTTTTTITTTTTTTNKNVNFNFNEGPLVQVLDADDIPVEVSDASIEQVDLHKAVFPRHKVVGWYRVVSPAENEDIEPTPEDLSITKLLKKHYASSDSDFFCFCLLKVQQGKRRRDQDTGDDAMKTEDTTATVTDTLNKELPINLYELHDLNEHTTVLLGLSNWQLETSPAERLSVERVMKERPSNGFGSEGGNSSTSISYNPFVIETKAIQQSLVSMKDRVRVLAIYLEDVNEGKRQMDHGLLRKIQQIVCSLGPLSSLAAATNEGEEEDVEMLAHLAIVARTVNTIQSYTEKFRVMNESRNNAFERHSQSYF